MILPVVLTIFFGCLVSANAAKFYSKHLPDYITPCKRTEPNDTDCLRKSTDIAIQNLVKGDKEYKIPNLVPMKVSRLEFQSGNNLRLTLTDVSIFGLNGFRTKDMYLDHDKKGGSLKLVTKELTIEGNYDIKGSILILPISGNGPAKIVFDNLGVKYDFDYDLIKKGDGKEYVKIKNPHVEIDIPKAHFNFENLISGNKQLAEQMENFLSENSKEVSQEIGVPLVSEITEIIVAEVLDAILNVVPYDEVFPV